MSTLDLESNRGGRRSVTRATWTAWGALAALSAGCAGAPAPLVQPPKNQPAEAAQPAPSGPVAMAEPAPSLVSDTDEPSLFHEWARFGANVQLFPVGDHAIVSGPAINSPLGVAFLLLTSSGELKDEERLNRGIEGIAVVTGVVGEWPKPIYASYVASDGRVGWSETSRLDAKGWTRVLPEAKRWLHVGMSQWSNGRIISLAFDTWRIDDRPPTFRVLPVGAAPAVPKLTPYPNPKEPAPPRCRTNLAPTEMLALETGHVFVFGVPCGPSSTPGNLEWFAPGDTQPRVALVAGLRPDEQEFARTTSVVRSAEDIYISHRGSLLHFNGSEVRLMPEIAARRVTASAEGTVWIAAGDAVWRLPGDGKWERLRLPEGAQAEEIFAPHDARVFVAGGGKLHALGAPPEGGPTEHSLKWGQRARASLRLPVPAQSDCEQPFVLMYAFTKVTPADYDFPLTRKAIRGQTWLRGARFVVTEDNGKRYFGAFTEDYEQGKRLASHIQKHVKGSIPALLCASPQVLRELPIDLRTGEVVKGGS